MSRIQTLKSANTCYVDLQQARRIADERLLFGDSTGNGQSDYCGAGWNGLNFDVYHRPAAQSTLKLDIPACGGGGVHSVASRLSVENQERPYIASAACGFRGGDTLGVGRERIPTGIYDGDAERGAFVRHYPGAVNAPPHHGPGCGCCSAKTQTVKRFDGSMSAVHKPWFG